MHSRLVSIALLALVVGCSSGNEFPTAKVRGKITYRNNPVPNGTVLFVPQGDKPTATGELNSDGTYELTTYEPGDGAVLGPHTIMITAVEEMTDKLPEQRSGTPKALVPVQYTSNSTSGLTAEVNDTDVNTIDFELKD
jgi:hypothetical protein